MSTESVNAPLISDTGPSDDSTPEEYTATFEAFTREHRGRLIGYLAASSYPSGLDIEDMTQEAFLGVWKRLQNTGDLAILTQSYIRMAGRNAVNDTFRYRKRHVTETPLSETFDATVAEENEDALSEITAGVASEAAIATLPPTWAEVVRLRIIEDYSVKQTAEALGLTTGTVGSMLKRALTRLRETPGIIELLTDG